MEKVFEYFAALIVGCIIGFFAGMVYQKFYYPTPVLVCEKGFTKINPETGVNCCCDTVPLKPLYEGVKINR